ncbi:hypothetical protein D187_001884 [Cystobacter fuscus DSM 2262]|uniref:Uncharacterized protein n=1 Tax=Cystobacter fuscus (strain ATCC 25194 / DSM 2262 / NBRC 100088 / M29) TaxID=1242864 RepID=S9PDK6_CYSF2|nr:hypothetical protein [Cystobacter fuscus]EPX60397.1 hypothetical protein D187_001884 [Cystobacter fuscus DSM 2262]
MATASLLVSLVLGGLLFDQSWRNLLRLWSRSGSQSYPDIIVGSITWSNSYKDFDFTVIYGSLLLVFAVFFVVAGVLNRLRFTWLEDREPSSRRGPLAMWLGAASILYALVLWVTRGAAPREELIGAGVLTASVGLSHAWARVVLKVKDLEAFSLEYLATLLLGAGLWFSGVGLYVLKELSSPHVLNPDLPDWLGRSALGLMVAVTVLSPYLSRRWSRDSWRRYVLGAQALTPLLLFVLLKDAYQQGEHITRMNVPAFTVFLLGLFILAAMFSVGLRMTRPPAEPEPLEPRTLITWPFVVAVSIFLVHRQPVFSTLVFLDHFHLGELLTPWQQIVDNKQDFYFGFISLQWLLGMVYGGINALFLEGTASSFVHGFMIWSSLVVGLTAYLLHRVVGGGWALVLAVFSLQAGDRHFLALPVLLILVLPWLLARPIPWLLVWGGLSVLHGFYNPSTGGALGVASLPMAGMMAWRSVASGAWRELWQRRRAWLVGGALAVAIVGALCARYLLGLVEFIRDNGSANATAYGISWFEYLQAVPSWFAGKFLMWDLLWIGGWLFGAVGLGWLSCRARWVWPRGSWEGRSVAALNVVSLLLLVLMIPYSMGRMDPGHLSRTGAMSVLTLGSLIPLGLVLETRVRAARGGLILGVAVLLGLKSTLTYVSPRAQVLQQLNPILVPVGVPLLEGEQLGLPRLGRMFMPQDALAPLLRLKGTLGALLLPGETYFDLTNLSSFYYYLGYRVTTGYVSDYTAIGAAAQKRMLAALEREPPPVVWVGPRMSFDGGPASLRSYRLYRWLVQRGYVFHARDGFQFLLREDRARMLKLEQEPAASSQALASVFHLQDLKSIPVSWGHSVKTLRRRFAEDSIEVTGVPQLFGLQSSAQGLLSASGADPLMVWELPEAVPSARFDFVSFQLECADAPDGRSRGQVFWAEAGGDFSEAHSFFFDARPGTLLVPLGSHPDWARGAPVRRLRLDFNSVEGCELYTVKDVRFLKLVD